MDNLISGCSMFYASNLQSFSGNLGSLQDGSSMFDIEAEGSMTAFTTNNLNSLIQGENMFLGCNFTNFEYDMPNLQEAYSMFYGCTLTSFTCNQTSLQQNKCLEIVLR